MRILYVMEGFPFPLTSGFLRHYHLLRELAAHHTITLVARVGSDHHSEYEDALVPYTARIVAIGGGARGGSMWRKVAHRAAVLVRGGDTGARHMTQAVAELTSRQSFDVAVLAGRATHVVLPALGSRLPIVVDLCDATSIRLRDAARHAAAGRQLQLRIARFEAERGERRLLSRAAHVVFASARDRAAVTQRDSASVIPNGVDAVYWRRTRPDLGRDQVVFTGAMRYPPNEDAALHLVADVWPQVRARRTTAHLWLVGRDPGPRLRAAAAGHDDITVTGTVPDVRPYLDRAAVFAAPLRFGAGIQNKVLEAMAMEVPAIVSGIAAEGLRLADGSAPPCSVATDAADCAARIVAGLDAAQAGAAPDAGARVFVERHFTWLASGAALDRVLRAVSGSQEHASSR